MLRIGITGTGSLIGQAIIKSIKESSFCRDCYVVGFDYFKNTVGSYWVNKNHLLPDILDNKITESQWVNAVTEALGNERLQILLIGLDFELKLFAKYGQKMEQATGCKIVVSDKRVIEIADDKYLTFQFLKNNGLHFPQTYLATELSDGKVKFPAILKPRVGARSRGVYVVRNDGDLNDKLMKIKDPILQELVGDDSEEYTCAVIFFDHQVKEMIALKRELRDGNTYSACHSRSFPRSIYDYIHKIAMKLEPYGACNFQLRIDSNNIPKLFEINARHSGTTYMRSLFGFQEVEYVIRYVLGQEIPRFEIRDGLVKRYFEEIFIGAEGS
ncbi:MAG: ATP-grasp domain-containing protein [Desulfobacterales bacterium]|nr:ATP-grasp domain-containing protein [Desulfobacterales bacterium]